MRVKLVLATWWVGREAGEVPPSGGVSARAQVALGSAPPPEVQLRPPCPSPVPLGNEQKKASALAARLRLCAIRAADPGLGLQK